MLVSVIVMDAVRTLMDAIGAQLFFSWAQLYSQIAQEKNSTYNAKVPSRTAHKCGHRTLSTREHTTQSTHTFSVYVAQRIVGPHHAPHSAALDLMWMNHAGTSAAAR